MSSQIRDTELRTNNIIDLRPSLEVRYDISDEKQKVTKVEGIAILVSRNVCKRASALES